MPRVVLLDPKLSPHVNFSNLEAEEIFHFQNFWDVSMRKEQQQPSCYITFAKIWSERVLKIKTKSNQVWATKGKRFLIGSCEFGHPGL